MRAFRFSLQKLLDTKDALVELGEARLAEQTRALESLRGHAMELRTMLRNLADDAGTVLQSGSTTRHELSVHYRYRTSLECELAGKMARIAAGEEVLHEMRDELMKVVSQRKMLERLKEKEWRKWCVESIRGEREEMDGIAADGFIQKRRIA